MSTPKLPMNAQLLEKHDGTVYFCEANAPGSVLATIGTDRICKFHTLKKGKPVGASTVVMNPPTTMTCGAWSPEGDKFTLGLEVGGGWVLSAKGHFLYNFAVSGGVTALKWSTASNFILCGTKTGETFFIDASTGKVDGFLKLSKNFQNSIREAVWLDDDKYIIGYSDGTMVMSTRSSLGVLKVFQAHGGPVVHMDYNSTSSRLVTSSEFENLIRVWDPNTASPLFSFDVEKVHTAWLGISPNGSSIAACSFGGQAWIWKMDGQLVANISIAACSYGGVFSPDGKFVAFICEGLNLQIVELQSGSVLHEFEKIMKHKPASMCWLKCTPAIVFGMEFAAGQGGEVIFLDVSQIYNEKSKGKLNEIAGIDQNNVSQKDKKETNAKDEPMVTDKYSEPEINKHDDKELIEKKL